MGNYDLARKGAQIMDILAEYDHLPELGNVMVCQRRDGVAVTAAFYGTFPATHRALGLWAQPFHAPVTLLKSQAGSRVKTRVSLYGEWTLELDEPAHHDQVIGYAHRCGLVAPWEKRLTVSAESFLIAVEAEMAVAS